MQFHKVPNSDAASNGIDFCAITHKKVESVVIY